MKSLLATKGQFLKVWMPVLQPFYEMKLNTSKFKILTRAKNFEPECIEYQN